MKTLTINNKSYVANQIATVNTPKTKEHLIRRAGINVIASTPKALNSQLPKLNITCIIVYSATPDISEYMESILDKAYTKASEELNFTSKDIYIKTPTSYIPYEPKRLKRDFKDERAKAKEESIENYISKTLDEFFRFQRVPEKQKDKLRKYIKYYELPYPQTEAEWTNTYFYIKYLRENDIPYSFDQNLYYICPECDELIRRGTEEEHICYTDIAPKRTHLDYVLNGEEGDEF